MAEPVGAQVSSRSGAPEGERSSVKANVSRPRGWIGASMNEHPVLFVFVIALFLRVAIAVFIVLADLMRDVAPDAITYMRLASEKATGDTGDWSPRDHDLYGRFSAFLIPTTVLFRAFGTHAVIGQLLAALAGAGAAAAVCALALRVLDQRWALFAGFLVALLPSQVLWSSVALRDGPVWLGTSLLALLVGVALQGRGARLLWVVAGVVLVGLYVGNLRDPSMVVAMWALVATMFLARGAGYLTRIFGAVGIVAVVPLLAGAGPFGLEVTKNEIPAESRVAEARGNTAIFDPSEAQDSGGGGGASEAADDDQSEDGFVRRSDLTYLPTGLRVMLLEPLPNSSFSGTTVNLAKLEMALWYPLLGLALVGLVVAARQQITLFYFPIIAGGALLVGFALSEGNFGTAFRHRGELVFVVALLAALGGQWLWEARAVRRTKRVGG